MKLYRLGTVPWQDSQLLYHSLPHVGREGVILCSPATTYVCIGYFQDAEQEVDLEFCRENDIPLFRRELGGGATYLDGEQLFFQLIIHRDNPLIPTGGKLAFYRKFLQAPIESYRALGIPAEYREVNDIIANQRKVSGCGAGEIGDYYVLVGNLIVDFNYEMMARVLKVPDEKFRDKIYKTIYENLSTIKREINHVPPREELWSLMAAKFIEMLGPMEIVTAVDEEWRVQTDELATRFLDDEWLHQKRRSRAGRFGKAQRKREVTIRAGVQVRQKMYKAPGGLIRATTEVRDGAIASISLSGDFFFFPEEKLANLEAALVGVREAEAEAAITHFYREHGIESPGVTPADFARVLV
ncbi:MAG: lipoate protein ligase C-terminal domain-containing protein [Chloroflexota bacterium]|nr:lipoate protein ligase C-terminal domain-containing protein [Chloroflexota bacterium]